MVCACIYIYIYICVCVRERERESMCVCVCVRTHVFGEEGGEVIFQEHNISHYKGRVPVCVCLCPKIILWCCMNSVQITQRCENTFGMCIYMNGFHPGVLTIINSALIVSYFIFVVRISCINSSLLFQYPVTLNEAFVLQNVI